MLSKSVSEILWQSVWAMLSVRDSENGSKWAIGL
jgi:hypothetical protein